MDKDVYAFNSALELLYKGIQTPEYWQQFLQEARVLLKGANASLIVTHQHSASQNQILSTFDDEVLTNYVENYAHKDTWSLSAMEKGLTHTPVVDGEALVADKDIVKTEFYADFMQAADFRYTLASLLSCDDQQMIVFTLNRSKAQGAANVEQKHWLSLLAPHLKHAVELRTLVDRSKLSHAHDQDSQTIVLAYEPSGVLKLYANNFDHLRSKGVYLDGSDSYFAHHNLSKLVRQFVQQNSQRRYGEQTLPLKDRSNMISHLLKLKKTNSTAAEGLFTPAAQKEQMVLALISPLKSPLAGAQRFAEFFKLSKREYDVLICLAKGFTLNEASDILCIAKETGRAHLKKIFSKANVNSQPELLHLVNSLND